MFSNSSAYLGGASAARSGVPQYGQSSFGPQQQQQQQPNAFPQQGPGFGGAMQPQMTGYPAQQPPLLQHQQTAFQSQNSTSFQQPPIPQQTGFHPQQQAPQSTGFQVNQPPQPQAPRQQPQTTGMTSAQMADSFRSSPAQSAPPVPAPTKTSKIPNMRLSFITAEDQAKFEQLFKSAVGNDQAIPGDKARDLLLRSKLPGNTLGDIWQLSDTTKSGQLLFPEFALAMYLCNLKLVGKDLPASLPDKIRNEVSSMVDIISFGIPDDQPQRSQRTNAPNFDEPHQSSFASQPVQQPKPQQASNTQLLSQLVSQPTGFGQGSFQQSQTSFSPQHTAFQPNQHSFKPQSTGFPQQPTGLQQNPQPTGYSGLRPPMPPMPTGFQQNNQTGLAAPLNAQPTGQPGKWGLVNAPASGLPNIEALQLQMMPQPGREGGFSTTGLRGNATVPWAVTKDEKKVYDNLFKAWDGFNKGYITGNQAIEIFSQSGLEKSDLETVWTLSDPGNKGRLDLDEFAVAMHLIYRKLNGYPVPNRLPPELVPPSTRNLNSSLGAMKSMLSRDAEERKNPGSFLEPQNAGVSYLKTHSFRGDGGQRSANRKDATVFRNNDEEIGYKSSARHRIGAGGRSPSPALSSSSVSEQSQSDEISLDQLQKLIREKQVLLDAIDFQDENQADEDEVLDRNDQRDANDLYRRIRHIQEDIDSHPNASVGSSDSSAERRILRRHLQSLADRLPDIASQVRRTEKNISDARLELFRLRDAKAYPSSATPISGTGPGGALTESDKLKARAKAMMQQRSAALAGKSVSGSSDESAAATQRFEEESSKVRTEKDNNDRMVHDVEESVTTYSKGVEDNLKEGQDDPRDHERRRWEDGLGVENEVRDFIYDLQRGSRSARIRREENAKDQGARSAPQENTVRPTTASRIESSTTRAESPSQTSPAPSSGTYSALKTPEDRAAHVKKQAEARMAERMAALGLRAPAKAGESAEQKQQREDKERRERLKQEEAEDSRREQERQRRLAEEQVTPPVTSKAGKKPPPAPPSRKNRADSMQKQQEAEAKRLEQEKAERTLKEQQEQQEAETSRLREEELRQEQELQKEREASEARRRAMEEQVRQGKIKREEEKQRRRESAKQAKEREDRLAAQRAELEAARKREEELQKQLDAMGKEESSSDEEGPQQIERQTSVASYGQDVAGEPVSSPPLAPRTAPSMPSISEPDSTAQSPPVSSPSTAAAAPPVSQENESKNPFFKSMQSPTSAATTAQAPTTQIQTQDTNPFHRMSQSQSHSQTAQVTAPITTQFTGNRTRRKPSTDEDDWSAIDSSDDEGSESDVSRGPGGGAKELASILFGTMAPPKPAASPSTATAEGEGKSGLASSPATRECVTSPPMASPQGTATGPPPPPPMPEAVSSTGAAPPAPPPPPPLAGGPPPPAPPPPHAPAMPSIPGALPPSPPPTNGTSGDGAPGNHGALLGQIKAGRGLKKVQTKDRSASSVAGRVL